MVHDPAPPLLSVAGLVGCRVRNAPGVTVGRVRDVVVQTGGDAHPLVLGVIARIGRHETFVHAEQVAAVASDGIDLESARVALEPFVRRDGELLLVHDVLDHQLVDINGVRVVRAADLYLAATDDGWRLVGVDAGTRPLVRRLVPGRSGRAPLPDAVIDWAEVEPVAAGAQVLQMRESSAQLQRLRPAQVADLLENLGRQEREALLDRLGPARAADALEELPSRHVADVLRTIPVTSAAVLIEEMEPDEAVDALRRLPELVRRRLLDAVPERAADRLAALLAFPAETAGGLMTARVVTASPAETVAQVVDRLGTEHPGGRDVDSVAVVDPDGCLVDDVPLFDLLVAARDTVMGELCDHHFVVVGPSTELGALLAVFVDSRRTSVLVQDDAGRPVGRVLADDLLDAIMPRPIARVPGPRG